MSRLKLYDADVRAPGELRPPSGRLRSVDALRGAAAISVVAFHAVTFQSNNGPKSFALSDHLLLQSIIRVLIHGDVGVALFFVISGFCIHLRWANQVASGGDGRIDFFSFWKRRLVRLYPPYFVAICISMILLMFAFARHMPVYAVRAYPGSPSHWIPFDFLAHCFMLHGLTPSLWKSGGNSVYWTLAIEEYFYLMYFPLLKIRRRSGLLACAGAVIILGLTLSVAASGLPTSWRDFANSSAPVLWMQWVLGMAAAEAYVGLTRFPLVLRSRLMLVPWLALAVVCSSSHVHLGTWQPGLRALLWGMTFFVLLNSCVAIEMRRREEHTRQSNTSRLETLLAKIGVFSYSLYLVHLPVRSSVNYLLGAHARQAGPVGFTLIAIAMGVGGLAAGWLFFQLVERPCLQALRRKPASMPISVRRPSTAPALSAVFHPALVFPHRRSRELTAG